jgi:3-(3-hydroxy-phenyl)propionate hydroxylase
LFDQEVVDVRQAADTVSIDVRGPSGVKSHSGVYLIGADGGRSVVRKRSDIAFDGFTWPERFIVLTTPFDFEAERGYCYRSYFAEPGAWCNCFKVSADGPPGLWRTVFPTEPSQTDDALMSDTGAQDRMRLFFPDQRPYEIIHRNLYVTHQRVAATFRKGRVLLAGDAAHVNNPIGGMGLNGGIQDAVNLSDKLIDVLLDGQSDRVLDLYDLQRRTVAVEFVQEQSIANKKRLEESDPVTRQKNLDELSRIADDPARARQFLLRTAMIASQRRAESITLN